MLELSPNNARQTIAIQQKSLDLQLVYLGLAQEFQFNKNL